MVSNTRIEEKQTGVVFRSFTFATAGPAREEPTDNFLSENEKTTMLSSRFSPVEWRTTTRRTMCTTVPSKG